MFVDEQSGRLSEKKNWYFPVEQIILLKGSGGKVLV